MKGVGGFNRGAVSSGSTSAAEVVEKDYVGLSEATSSHPATTEEAAEEGRREKDEEDLELGLSLGAKNVAGGGGGKAAAPWGQSSRILTANDFHSLVYRPSPKSSSTSSVSSSSAAIVGGVGGGGVAGTKRAADSVAPEVVGSGHPPRSIFLFVSFLQMFVDFVRV
ncbi:putative auxin-responsive protein IAA10 [Cocos nucifera]|uniref:Putative auxin-responsive protein IAA10 n=1 Tax=Cocos nucifera TaxID=13894 RepID=A0A8K0IL89_COCNU|nr:putative auxin-responsive protein IAA10 [Cocos nucifera]